MKIKLLPLVIMGSKLVFYGIALQLFFVGLLLAADGNAQKILRISDVKLNIDADNATVEEVFEYIENRTNYHFFFDGNTIEMSKKVQLQSRKSSISDILMQVSAQTNLGFRQINEVINVHKKEKDLKGEGKVEELLYQDKLITGKVISGEDNSGLPGVNVIVKGTSQGTVTDVEGNFALEISADASIIVFSSVGFLSEEVSVDNLSVINITLFPDITSLEEIVVIGYGSVKKSDLTGSLSSVGSRDFQEEPVRSFAQALEGRTTGVTVKNNSGAPGTSPKIRIRGMNSLNGNNDPLYVVDGVTLNIDINNMNVNDIESIEVLKDASATAIYGSRGANGVIIITTKKGKEGKLNAQLNVNVGVNNLANPYDIMDAGTFAETVNVYRPDYFSQEEIATFKREGGVDWQDQIFQTGLNQDYQLNLSGGSDKLNFFISGNYLDQKGIVLNTSEKKYSVRSNISAKLNERVSFDLNLFATRRNGLNNLGNGGKNSPNWTAAIYSPTFPVFTPEGAYNRQDNLASPNAENPYMAVQERYDDYLSSSIGLNAKLGIDIIDGLHYDFQLGTDFGSRNSAGYQNKYINSTTGAYQSESKSTSLQMINVLSYQRSFNEIHDITLSGIYEQTQFNYRGFSATGNDINPMSVGYNNLGIAVSQSISSYQSESALRSYAARFNYSLHDRYLLTATYRADGSSKFQGDNKWAYFPSVAAGWIVSNESFLASSDFVTSLKIRAGWGETGNQGIDSYATIARIGSINPNFGLSQTFPGSTVEGADNPDLKWETTKQTNIGFDFLMLEGRVGISADYFDKQTEDLLHGVTIPQYNGGGIVNKNIGSMENKGFEFEIVATPIEKSRFTWETSLNYSSYKNKLLELGSDTLILTGANSLFGNEQIFAIKVGESLGSFYGYAWQGVYKTNEAAEAAEYGFMPGDNKYLDYNNDGVINSADRHIIGSALPDFVWGFNNDITIGNFDINLLFVGSQGNQVLNTVYASATSIISDATSITHVDGLDYWTPDNEDAGFASPTGSSGKQFINSSQFLEDGSYVKLKNIAVGYNLTKETLGFANVRLVISGQNLLTFTKFKGYDPEASTSSGDTDGAVDIGAYPAARTYTFRILANF
jgi:TonB-linked SusC/RagA family outer membrane protein